MSKISTAAKKVGEFIKRNAFYLLILLCIASVATVIALAASGDFGADPGAEVVKPVPDDDDDTPVTPEPDDDDDTDKPDEPEKPTLSFASPVNGTVTQEFSDTALVWNATLGQYEVHLGVDFTGDDLSVFAAEAGTVSDVVTDVLDGTYVVIDHEDGYQTRYYSLDENVQVAKATRWKRDSSSAPCPLPAAPRASQATICTSRCPKTASTSTPSTCSCSKKNKFSTYEEIISPPYAGRAQTMSAPSFSFLPDGDLAACFYPRTTRSYTSFTGSLGGNISARSVSLTAHFFAKIRLTTGVTIMLAAMVTTPMNGDCPMPALKASPKVGSPPSERSTK